MEPLHAMVHGWCCDENERLTKELKQLQRDNEVLYRDNVTLSETADRLREALERISCLPVSYGKAMRKIAIDTLMNRAALEQEAKK